MTDEIQPIEFESLKVDRDGIEGQMVLTQEEKTAWLSHFAAVVAGAPNYMTASFSMADRLITVTAHRPGSRTPHQLRQEAEAKLAEVAAILRRSLSEDGRVQKDILIAEAIRLIDE